MLKTQPRLFGATATVEYDYYANSLYNDDEELNKIAHDAAVKLYGEACLKELPQMMGSEDFAFFADKIPAVFGFLGTRNEELGMTVGNHNDRYTVHEPVLQRGAALSGAVCGRLSGAWQINWQLMNCAGDIRTQKMPGKEYPLYSRGRHSIDWNARPIILSFQSNGVLNIFLIPEPGN